MAAKQRNDVQIVPEAVAAAEAAAPTLHQRHNMALQHFLGASHFCREVQRIEQENKGKPFGPFFEQIIWNFSSCVILCVSSVEAYLNETMDDRDFDDDLVRLIERTNTLDRYVYFLKLSGRSPLVRGSQPAQFMAALIDLRNALVHFKPEWDYEPKKHKTLENKLPKLPNSPFLEPSAVFFPQRCMTYGYAEWSVTCTYSFLEEFSKLADISFKLPGRMPKLGKP